MSHNINYYTYKEQVDRKKVYAELNDMVRHETWQEGGSLDNIRWLDTAPICDSYEEAQSYIEAHDRKWYDCLAVRYRSVNDNIKSVALEKAKARRSECYEKYASLSKAFHFADTKSEYIGCKNCGSKISHKYLRGNYCPVCHNDLRPQSTLDRIKSLKTSFEKACDDVKAIENNLAKKSGKVMWLVKIEYHT